MDKKVVYVILIILFIAILIILNKFLSFQNQKMLGQNGNITEIENKINEEESKVEILKVTSENFDKEVLQSEKPVLIDFYADWCGPCKMLSPIVEEVASEREDAKVVKINIDDEQELAIKYGVMSIPTLVVVKNGEEVNRSVGLVSKENREYYKIVVLKK